MIQVPRNWRGIEQVKLYELQDEQGNFHYVTRQFIGKVD